MKVKRQISLGFRDLAPLQLMINFWNKKSIQLFLIVHFIFAALFLDTSCQIIKFLLHEERVWVGPRSERDSIQASFVSAPIALFTISLRFINWMRGAYPRSSKLRKLNVEIWYLAIFSTNNKT